MRTEDDELLLTGSAPRGGAGGGARRGSGASGSDDAPPRTELSLAQTISEGARVTAPMAAAALDELLGFSTDKGGRFAEERFVD